MGNKKRGLEAPVSVTATTLYPCDFLPLWHFIAVALYRCGIFLSLWRLTAAALSWLQHHFGLLYRHRLHRINGATGVIIDELPP